MILSRILILLLILLLNLPVFSQKEFEKGLEFYRKGEYESAIKFFELVSTPNKKNGEFWNLLGESYFSISRFSESRKALEKAVKLNPQNAEFRTNLAFANYKADRLKQAEKDITKAIALNSQNANAFYIRGLIFLSRKNFNLAIADANQALSLDKSKEKFYLLKSDAILYQFGQEKEKGKDLIKFSDPLQKSIENLEACLMNCNHDSALVKNQAKLDDLKSFYQYFVGQKGLSAPNDDPTVTPMLLLKNPKPNYTDSARQGQFQGVVTLAVLFSEDGNTKKVLVLNPLPYGLTDQAVLAAQQIKFNPQLKDGKPVSVVKIVQYSFTLY